MTRTQLLVNLNIEAVDQFPPFQLQALCYLNICFYGNKITIE